MPAALQRLRPLGLPQQRFDWQRGRASASACWSNLVRWSSSEAKAEVEGVSAALPGPPSIHAASATVTYSGDGAHHAKAAAQAALHHALRLLGPGHPPTFLIASTSAPRTAAAAAMGTLAQLASSAGREGEGHKAAPVPLIGCLSRRWLAEEVHRRQRSPTSGGPVITAQSLQQGGSSSGGGSSGDAATATYHVTVAAASLPQYTAHAFLTQSDTVPQLPHVREALLGVRPLQFLLLSSGQDVLLGLEGRLENLFGPCSVVAGAVTAPDSQQSAGLRPVTINIQGDSSDLGVGMAVLEMLGKGTLLPVQGSSPGSSSGGSSSTQHLPRQQGSKQAGGGSGSKSPAPPAPPVVVFMGSASRKDACSGVALAPREATPSPAQAQGLLLQPEQALLLARLLLGTDRYYVTDLPERVAAQLRPGVVEAFDQHGGAASWPAPRLMEGLQHHKAQQIVLDLPAAAPEGPSGSSGSSSDASADAAAVSSSSSSSSSSSRPEALAPAADGGRGGAIGPQAVPGPASLQGLPMFVVEPGFLLFPGQEARLRVFEKRYQLMMQACIAQGAALGFPVGPLGITARVTRCRQEGDSLSVYVVGGQRFSYRPEDVRVLPASFGLHAADVQYVKDDPAASYEEDMAARKAARIIMTKLVQALILEEQKSQQEHARQAAQAGHSRLFLGALMGGGAGSSDGSSSMGGAEASNSKAAAPAGGPAASASAAGPVAGASAAGTGGSSSSSGGRMGGGASIRENSGATWVLTQAHVDDAWRRMRHEDLQTLSLQLPAFFDPSENALLHRWFQSRHLSKRLEEQAERLAGSHGLAKRVAQRILAHEQHPMRYLIGFYDRDVSKAALPLRRQRGRQPQVRR